MDDLCPGSSSSDAAIQEENFWFQPEEQGQATCLGEVDPQAVYTAHLRRAPTPARAKRARRPGARRESSRRAPRYQRRGRRP